MRRASGLILVLIAASVVTAFSLLLCKSSSSSDGADSLRVRVESVGGTFVDGPEPLVDISGRRLTPEDARRILGDSVIVNLRARHLNMSSDFLTYIPSNAKLKRVDLSWTKVGQEGLKSVARNCDLLELRLAYCDLGQQAIDAIAEMSQLRVLHLTGAISPDVDLAPLTRLINLRDLQLVNNVIKLDFLEGMDSLEILNLTETNVSDEDLEFLIDSQLTSLALSNTDVTDEGLGLVSRLPLEHLFVHDTKVTDNGVSHFMNNDTLVTFGLSRTLVTNKVIEILDTTNLWSVDVRETAVTKRAVDWYVQHVASKRKKDRPTEIEFLVGPI